MAEPQKFSQLNQDSNSSMSSAPSKSSTDCDCSAPNSLHSSKTSSKNAPSAKSTPQWVAAIDEKQLSDHRIQPWKAEIGDLVTDKQCLGYTPFDKVDMADMLLKPQQRSGPTECSECGSDPCRCGPYTFTG